MRVPAPADFTSRLHDPAVATRVGQWLGACFAVAFVTGLVSHWAQDPQSWLPSSPAWGYRVTQGVHVASGTAAVPLLLVKLWTVYPRLFTRPPRLRADLVRHGLERASIGVLVAAAVFQVATGLLNTSQWYPWAFAFRQTHYAVAWVAIGALAVHVAVKWPLVRDAWAHPEALDEPAGDGLTRRGLVRAAGLAAVAAVVLTAGSAVPALRRVSVLAVRSGDGPGGVPVNRSAEAAGVVELAGSPAYLLEVVHGGTRLSLTREELLARRQRTETLPIACVEGWSASGDWTGVCLRDLLDEVGAPPGSAVRFTSLQPRGGYRTSELPGQFADDPRTLLALGLAGEPLSLDHGYPCRLIAPNRPGVLQTKWVSRVEVLA